MYVCGGGGQLGETYFKDPRQNQPLGLQPTRGNYEDWQALPTQGGHLRLGLKLSVKQRGVKPFGCSDPRIRVCWLRDGTWPSGAWWSLGLAPQWVLTVPKAGA